MISDHERRLFNLVRRPSQRHPQVADYPRRFFVMALVALREANVVHQGCRFQEAAVLLAMLDEGWCRYAIKKLQRQMHHVLAGYEEFMAFDRRDLRLLEALRTLRLIHYSAWIARRWDDPAFPAAFPWFNTQRYWQDRILELREQIALMTEPPIEID